MTYKLVAIDMDGTLLNSQGEVSDRTRRAIYEAGKKGIYIVLATGRILKSALNHSIELNINKPIISSNGAVIADENKNIIYERPMKSKAVEAISNIGTSENIYYHFYGKDVFYSNVYIEEVLSFYNTEKSRKEGNDIKLNIFKDISEVINDRNASVYKFLFLDEDRKKLDRLKYQLEGIDDISICTSWGNNLEVMDKEVSKGNSLKYLCDSLNISSKEVIAIGDNENDISMLDYAGLGVAMENGVDIVRSMADLITSTNDKDGVAKVIEEFIL